MFRDPPRSRSTHNIWTVYGNKQSPISSNSLPRRPIIEYQRKRPLQPQSRGGRSPLRKWCKVTGWHGIIDCYQAENAKARVFWGLTIAVTALLGANQIMSMLFDYWSEDQWVSNIHFVNAGPQGLPMPNVTLCSLNLFNQSYMDWLRVEPSAVMLAKSQDYYAFYQQFFSAKPVYPNTSEYNEAIKEDSAHIQQLLARMAATDKAFGVQQFLRNASHSCKASVLACGLTADPTIKNGASCCEKNSYDDSADQCIHLSFYEPSGQPLYVTNEASGVYLLLHPRLSDYDSVFLPENMPAAGFSITLSLLENGGSIPMLVSPGTHNVIWMTLEKRRTVKRKMLNAIQHFYYLPPPCTDDLSYKILDEAHYSPGSCRLDCDFQMSLERCGCVLSIGEPVQKPFTVCNAEQTFACGMRNESSRDAKAQFRKCRSQCIEPCSYGRIHLLHNSASFPAPNKAVSLQRYVSRVVGENFSMDDVRQFISVHIVYESMYIRVVEKFNRVSLDELISNIGGTLGVWAGISLITIIQVFAYLWYCIFRTKKGQYGK